MNYTIFGRYIEKEETELKFWNRGDVFYDFEVKEATHAIIKKENGDYCLAEILGYGHTKFEPIQNETIVKLLNFSEEKQG